jgi:hypothetical protein
LVTTPNHPEPLPIVSHLSAELPIAHWHVVLLMQAIVGSTLVVCLHATPRLKRRESGRVVAPHPFFPASTCLGRDLDRYPMLFDAVECNAVHTKSLKFNRRAEHWAARHDRPLVGNCDVHRLWQLGTSYSLVDTELNADDICASIAAGRVRVESQPLTWVEVARTLGAMFLSDLASQPEPDWRARSYPDPSALGRNFR